MKPEEIFRLLDAGFTADDIRAMLAQPTPAPQPEPTPAPQPQPTPDSAILAAIQSLTETIKANNILHSNQPPQPQQSAADVIAEIIHPTFKKDK